jgi:hypothetical protein
VSAEIIADDGAETSLQTRAENGMKNPTANQPFPSAGGRNADGHGGTTADIDAELLGRLGWRLSGIHRKGGTNNPTASGSFHTNGARCQKAWLQQPTSTP